LSAAAEPYWAARLRVASMNRSSRSRLEIKGNDRARFLHNLTTNEVKRLVAGQGCEAFVTSLQGKTLGFVSLHVCEDHILLRADPGALAGLMPHFQKYAALDDVELADISPATFELHLCGPAVLELFVRLGGTLPGDADQSHQAAEIAGASLRIIRDAPTGSPGLTIVGRADDQDAVVAAIRERGASLGLLELDPETFDVLRIEAGTPVFGRDLTPDNLPQELGRDQRAINFVKGCYLGQETVARIDALGHVNKVLRGLRVEDPGAAPPPPGSALKRDGKPVGAVTSAAFSPGWEGAVVLGYVRVGHDEPGQVLEIAAEPPLRAVVCSLPMIPDSHKQMDVKPG
jgi:tRNA-modifying protein YgfZ